MDDYIFFCFNPSYDLYLKSVTMFAYVGHTVLVGGLALLGAGQSACTMVVEVPHA